MFDIDSDYFYHLGAFLLPLSLVIINIIFIVIYHNKKDTKNKNIIIALSVSLSIFIIALLWVIYKSYSTLFKRY